MPQAKASINGAATKAAGLAAVRAAAGRALDVLLPPGCPACGAQVERTGALCAECWREADFLGPPQCAACGLPFEFRLAPAPTGDALCGACVRARPAFERARAVMAYGEVSRRVVLAFKHADRTDAAPALGRWLARAGAELIADAEVIAPVPLHWTRLFQRRYNQAALLALAVGRGAGVAVASDLLQRRKRTRPQGRMGPSQRRRNLKGAFRVHPGRKDLVRGRRVLLVDDVLTTGATAEACARVLTRAGAGAVDVLTVARVVRPAF